MTARSRTTWRLEEQAKKGTRPDMTALWRSLPPSSVDVGPGMVWSALALDMDVLGIHSKVRCVDDSPTMLFAT